MRHNIRPVLVFALVLLLAPALAWAGESADLPVVEVDTEVETSQVPCEAQPVAKTDGASEIAEILPTTVIQPAGWLNCPAAFDFANSCSDCWAAYNQCPGSSGLTAQECYFCTELCLGRLNCFIP